MGLFNRIKTTAVGIGSTVSKGTGRIAGKVTVEAKESAKITAVKADIVAVEADVESGYVAIGKLYVEKLLAGMEITDFGAGPMLKLLEPKLERKMELEKELAELEKALADSQVLQERQIVQDEVDEIKAKLDKAKAMGAISDEDYAARLAQANKKLDHFTEIRMLKKQKELGLLTSAEYDAKVNALLA
jgi:hypothetical protein